MSDRIFQQIRAPHISLRSTATHQLLSLIYDGFRIKLIVKLQAFVINVRN